jgi:uncharacterized protein (TIGR00725 family)
MTGMKMRVEGLSGALYTSNTMSQPNGRSSRKSIAVIGAGQCNDESDSTAYDVGRLIAERGAIVISGGSTGVMEAASRGAREASGLVVGILPGLDPRGANPFVDVVIPTGMGQLRNGLVINSAGAVIAIGGEWGTLSEIGFALKTGKPVIGWRTWELARGGAQSADIVRVDTAQEAVDEAFARYVG